MPLKYAYSLKTELVLREQMHNFEVRFAIVLNIEVIFTALFSMQIFAVEFYRYPTPKTTFGEDLN